MTSRVEVPRSPIDTNTDEWFHNHTTQGVSLPVQMTDEEADAMNEESALAIVTASDSLAEAKKVHEKAKARLKEEQGAHDVALRTAHDQQRWAVARRAFRTGTVHVYHHIPALGPAVAVTVRDDIGYEGCEHGARAALTQEQIAVHAQQSLALTSVPDVAAHPGELLAGHDAQATAGGLASVLPFTAADALAAAADTVSGDSSSVVRSQLLDLGGSVTEAKLWKSLKGIDITRDALRHVLKTGQKLNTLRFSSKKWSAVVPVFGIAADIRSVLEIGPMGELELADQLDRHPMEISQTVATMDDVGGSDALWRIE